jgi:hypothetical protein
VVLQNFHQRSEDKLNTSTLQPIFPNNCKIGEYPRPTYFMMLQKMHETKHRPDWDLFIQNVSQASCFEQIKHPTRDQLAKCTHALGQSFIWQMEPNQTKPFWFLGWILFMCVHLCWRLGPIEGFYPVQLQGQSPHMQNTMHMSTLLLCA